MKLRYSVILTVCVIFLVTYGVIQAAGKTLFKVNGLQAITMNDIEDGLIAYYPFTANANDNSGNGHHGTIIGGTVIEELFIGDNDTDRLMLPHTVANGLSDFTFAAWLKIDFLHTVNPGGFTPYNSWVSGANSTQDNEIFIKYHGNSDRWRIAIDDKDNNFDVNAEIEDGTFHHVVILRNGSISRLYVDGTEVGTGISVSGSILDIDVGGLIIGQDQEIVGGGFEANQSWAGKMDELRIYNRALTGLEIQEIYNLGIGRKGFLEFPIDYSSSDFATVAGLYEIEGGLVKTRVDHERTAGSYIAVDGVMHIIEPPPDDPDWTHAKDCRTGEFNACYDQANAIDVGIAEETPVLAAFTGKVVGLESDCVKGINCPSGFGNYVWLDHGNCYRTRYSHLKTTLVLFGQDIATGVSVGLSGDTGNSGGPHLDFQVQFDPNCTDGTWTGGSGVIVDPYGWNPFSLALTDPLATNTGYLWKHPLSTTDSIDSNGGALSNTNNKFKLAIPNGASSGILTVELGTGQYPAYPTAGWSSLGSGFWFRILEWLLPLQRPLRTNQFDVPADVQIVYEESILTHTDESTTTIHQWDETSSTWFPLSTTLDINNNLATAETLTHGIFNLQAQTLCSDVSEPNDEWNTAHVLEDDFAGSFDSSTDEDWYLITVEPGEEKSISTSGSAEVVLALYRDGTILLQADVTSLIVSVPSSGESTQFWVQLKRVSDQTGCVADYIIVLTDYYDLYLPLVETP